MMHFSSAILKGPEFFKLLNHGNKATSFISYPAKLGLSLFAFLAIAMFSFGQSLPYTTQVANFNDTRVEKNNNPPYAGTFDNGSTEVAQYANGGSFGNTPGAAAFRTFTVSGTNKASTAQPLKVGDRFTITVFSSGNPSAGGRIGLSFRNTTAVTNFFSSTDANTMCNFQLDDAGNWKIYHSGTTTSGSSAGSDRTLSILITSSTTFTATIGGTDYTGLSFKTTGSIAQFCIYSFGDNNPNSFWKNASACIASTAPTSITGITTICNPGSTTLTVAGGFLAPGATVQWFTGSCGGTPAGTGNSITVSPGATTTYFVRYSGICNTTTCVSQVVTVAPTTAISVDAAPSLQTVYINSTPANLTLTATGASLTYQWFSNTTNTNTGGTSVGAGNGGQTPSYTPPTNTLGTTYYYCEVTGTCGVAVSSAVTVTITNTNTWKQSNPNNNWNTASNWAGGSVPTGANDAAIPVGNTPYPVLSASASINNLIIDPGATVGIGSNTFTINGTVTGTGTLSGSATSSLVLNATTTVNFTPAANTLKDLSVTAGTTTLGNAVNITGGTAANTFGTVTVSTGATLASNGNLTIKSNQFGTARVAAGDVAGNYITGDVTVERFIPANAKRAWRLLSVPTKGTKTIKQTWQENQAANANGLPGFGTIITGNYATVALVQAAGFDAYSQNPSIQSYNSATQSWAYLGSTNAAPIETNKGYFMYIRGDRSLGVSVATNIVNATTLRTTGTLYQGNGNAAISVAAGKFEAVGNTYASAIDFTSLTKTGGISNTFYVWDSKLLAGTSLGAYQTFSSTVGYVPATPGGSYPASPNTTIESGEAFMATASGSAGTIALNEGSKTTGNQFTPFRPAAAPAQLRTSLYKVAGGTSILADNNIVVFDRAYANVVDANDALKLSHSGENLDIATDNQLLIIEARQPVGAEAVIHFNMKDMQAQQYQLDFSTLNMNTTGLTAFVEDKYLRSTTAIDLNNGSRYNFTVEAANAGSKAADRFRVVFKQANVLPVSNATAAISVSPNPVEGSVANLQFKGQPKGKYAITLLSTGGQIIFSTFAQHAGGNGTQLLSLPANVSRGTYQLEIVAPDKSRQVQTIFINSTK